MFFAFPRLSLDALRSSGLPLDWMTVYVGWTNAPSVKFDASLSVYDNDVRNLALNALAVCQPRDEDALFRIADDTSVHRTDIANYLRQFADRSGVSETDAMRKWRYVYLRGVLEPLVKWINGPRLPGGDYLPNVSDIDGETQWDIEYYVGQWDMAPKPPPLFGQTRAETLQNFDQFRAWLAQEKAELMQIPAVNPNDLQISVPPLQ